MVAVYVIVGLMLVALVGVSLSARIVKSLRNLQTLLEISVEKNSAILFPAPLMSTIQELGAVLDRETAAVGEVPATSVLPAARDGELPAPARTRA